MKQNGGGECPQFVWLKIKQRVYIHLRILAASVIAALVTLFTVAIAYVLAAPLPPGDHAIIMKHGGRERSAVVHVPPRAEGSGIYPGLID